MEPARPRSSGYLAPRRVFTAPVPPPAPQPAASPQAADGLVDTLYDHPNVKIISFTAGANSLFVGQRTGAGSDIEPGSLSWSSQLERTIAVGPFRIYRAPGSVAFLSCGSALQPILPKSQVWCVDEESSKFVLQIRRPQYWRIEVPVGDDEEARLAQQLREVFDAILQFEKTECPFSRPFTVELPDRPDTPARRRPWTPRRSSESLSLASVTPEIARLHDGTPRGSICIGDLRTVGETRRALDEHARSLFPRKQEWATTESDQAVNGQSNSRTPSSLFPARVERPRSVSAVPPQRPFFTGGSLPKIREAAPPADVTANAPRFTSPTESLESIRGRESWLPTPLPPSPPLSTPGSPRSSSQQLQTPHVPAVADTPRNAVDQPVTSEPSKTQKVVTANSLPESERTTTTTAPSSIHTPRRPPVSTEPQRQPVDTPQPTATPTSTGPETPFKTASSTPVPTSPSPSPSTPTRRPALRRATTTSSSLSFSSPSPRQALSPLPPAANLLTTRRQPQLLLPPPPLPPQSPPPPLPSHPGMQGALAAVRRLPMTVLQKTCAMLLGPPSYLLRLMLKVAARIIAGEWRGLVFGWGEGGERVSVTWDWSDDEYGGGGGQQQREQRGVGDDFWLRGRTGRGGAKMVGAFPDSEDEDGDDDDDDDEGGVGPLDRSVLASPGRKRGSVASQRARAEQGAATGGGGGKGGGKPPAKESDSESGVD
ncbi:inheritance of peroxisomes protein 1-domain-containing protein [Chaetomium fimeti]|uniref:Inheritance of peroxisomes protein 1 n=1 Tax=Chaetomium fimeti TaxID=1854472 RepID=A0AAE0HRS4_9PEZI|nr:inheritance of peroxisomes protein 1-domain-containing protein [Chaetomium fimeti]